MATTVLAGPIEFSPAEIAAILAVLAGLFLVLTAPGWLAVGWAMGRRSAPSRARWGARVGGSLLGLAVSGVVFWAVVGVVGLHGMTGLTGAVLGAWLTCGALALVLRPGGRPPAEAQAPVAGQPEGWGR